MPSDGNSVGCRRPAGHSQRLRFNRRTSDVPVGAPIEFQTLFMKSSLWDLYKPLELGTPTVARLGQPTEVAGEWRPPLPSTPTRCSGCRGSFPLRAPKEGSQRGAVTTLCTWRRSCSCCRAAQQEKPAELVGREPSAGGGWYGGLARLGAARAHGGRQGRGKRAFGLFFNVHERTTRTTSLLDTEHGRTADTACDELS